MIHEDNNAKATQKTNENSTEPPSTPLPGGNGLSSGLQPSGTIPGGGPGASVGSIGTGGGPTGGTGTGNAA
jgi:hypothetical protein